MSTASWRPHLCWKCLAVLCRRSLFAMCDLSVKTLFSFCAPLTCRGYMSIYFSFVISMQPAWWLCSCQFPDTLQNSSSLVIWLEQTLAVSVLQIKKRMAMPSFPLKKTVLGPVHVLQASHLHPIGHIPAHCYKKIELCVATSFLVTRYGELLVVFSSL